MCALTGTWASREIEKKFREIFFYLNIYSKRGVKSNSLHVLFGAMQAKPSHDMAQIYNWISRESGAAINGSNDELLGAMAIIKRRRDHRTWRFSHELFTSRVVAEC